MKVNQQMGGGTWLYLGHYDFAKGKQQLPIVELSNISDDDDAVVSADAVKIGGGMGNVARSPKNDPDLMPVTSDSPRFTEGRATGCSGQGCRARSIAKVTGKMIIPTIIKAVPYG